VPLNKDLTALLTYTKKKRKAKRERKYDPMKDGITQSLLGRFLSCRYAAMLYLQRLTPIGMKDTLVFGNLFHRVLEAMCLRSFDNDLPSMKQKARKKELLMVGRAALKKAKKIYVGTAANPQALENFIGQISLMLPCYLNHKEDGIRLCDYDYKRREFVAAEEKFRVDFHGYPLIGKIDNAFQHKSELWLMESKTAGQISDAELENALLVDLQIKFYLTASRLHFEKTPEGVLYNIIRRPKHTVMANFKKKLKEEPEHFFTRYEVSFTKPDMQKFHEEFRLMLEEFVQWTEGDLATYHNYKSCLGRKWNCDFLRLCATGDKSLYYTRDNLFEELAG